MGAGTSLSSPPPNPAPMPAQPQGLGALQNAYSQFMTQPPPQPSPMFGSQAQQASSVLDSFMNPQQAAPAAPPAPPPPMPASIPQPLYTQVRPEDARMQAMRGLQRYAGNPEASRGAYTNIR